MKLNMICMTRKLNYRKRRPRDVPYIWVPFNISGVHHYAHGCFSRNFQLAFVPIDPMNALTKFEVRIALYWPILDIIWGTPKIWQSLDTPKSLPFLQTFKWAFVRMDPANGQI